MKTKWIKSSAKQPLAPLAELLRRVDAHKGQKDRKSMAVSIYGEDDPEFEGDDDWQFNVSAYQLAD